MKTDLHLVGSHVTLDAIKTPSELAKAISVCFHGMH